MEAKKGNEFFQGKGSSPRQEFLATLMYAKYFILKFYFLFGNVEAGWKRAHFITLSNRLKKDRECTVMDILDPGPSRPKTDHCEGSTAWFSRVTQSSTACCQQNFTTYATNDSFAKTL